MQRHFLIVAATLLLGSTGTAATEFCVGSISYCNGHGARFVTLKALFDTGSVDLGPGDLVHVEGNTTYPAGDTIMRDRHVGGTSAPIVIRGERVNGTRPVLQGGANTFNFQNVAHVVLEGFAITGGSSRCIYVDAGDDITIRDVLVHDCPAHGLLSSEQSGSLTVEYSEFDNVGTGHNDSKHSIYAQTDEISHPGAVFTLRFSYLHNGQSGNLVKSRAQRTELSYNWIEHARVQEVEMLSPDPCDQPDADPCQDPGWSDDTAIEYGQMVGNVIVHGGTSQYSMRFGGDGTGAGSKGRYRLVNNTVICDGACRVLRPFAAIEAMELHNNVFAKRGGGTLQLVYDLDADWISGARIRGSNNWVAPGTTSVPPPCPATPTASCWTNTMTGPGADPGFVDLAGNQLLPLPASALVNHGNPTPTSPAGFAFPNPAPLPAFVPAQVALMPGGALARISDPSIDIGAFEALDEARIFADGFEP